MDIDKNEVLRYLGHRRQTLDAEMDALVEEMMGLCRSLAAPRWTHRRMKAVPGDRGIWLQGSTVCLEGEDIARHLKGAGEVAVMAVTMGLPLETRIRRLELGEMTRSLVLDAAATAMTESACDDCQAEIAREARNQGLSAGARFSPGYGDLPLSIQPGILALLDAGRRIGLTCTDSLILLPRKSVTAVVGLFPAGEAPAGSERRCESCAMAGRCKYHTNFI